MENEDGRERSRSMRTRPGQIPGNWYPYYIGAGDTIMVPYDTEEIVDHQFHEQFPKCPSKEEVKVRRAAWLYYCVDREGTPIAAFYRWYERGDLGYRFVRMLLPTDSV